MVDRGEGRYYTMRVAAIEMGGDENLAKGFFVDLSVWIF